MKFPPSGKRRSADAEVVSYGHGRIERREVWLVDASELTDYLQQEWGWSGVRLCGRIRRRRKRWTKHQWQEEEHIWVSSLTAEEVTAPDIANALRGHWVIENGVFYVRDVTYSEDRLHARTTGITLSAIRNTAINLIRMLGDRYIPDGRRRISASSDYGLSLMLLEL